MSKTTSDGQWHDVLNQLRRQLRRGMHAEIADNMRDNGLHYGINFGVTLPILQEIVKPLPIDSDLAYTMWGKDVREMKLLALMLLEDVDLTKEETHELALQSPTLEVSEQLVLRLIAPKPWATELASQLWHEEHNSTSQAAVVPYIILTRLSIMGQVTPELLNSATEAVRRDLQGSPPNHLQTYILRSLSRIGEEQSELHKQIIELATRLTEETEDSPSHLIGTELLSLVDFLQSEGLEI